MKATEKLSQAKHKVGLQRSTRFWLPIPTIILTFAVYISSQVIAVILVLAWPLLRGWESAQTDVWLERTATQFLLILLVEAAVMLLLWALLHIKKTSFTDIGLSWPRLKDLGFALLGFGVYFLLYIAVAVIAKLFVPSIDFEQEQQIGFESTAMGFDLALIFVSLVILPPIVEEVLARGFLYTGLKTKFPVWFAAIITSVLFAAAHLQFGSDTPLLWVAAIDTFILSLVLIYLREKTGKLGASILLHMLKNGLAFLLIFILGTR